MNIKCNGKNCNSTNGFLHSEECKSEHNNTVSGRHLKECFDAGKDNRNGGSFDICMFHNSCNQFGVGCKKTS